MLTRYEGKEKIFSEVCTLSAQLGVRFLSLSFFAVIKSFCGFFKILALSEMKLQHLVRQRNI